jgi:DNA polymerase II large subunit
MEIKATTEIKKYFEELNKKVKEQHDIAVKARKKGFDLSKEVECIPVKDLAERTESIAGPTGVAKRYRELMQELKGDRLKIMFKLCKEIIQQEWCSIPDESKRVEQAIKTCLVIETEGVVVAPLDGVPKIQISRNLDGSKYIDIYFAGPIRAAGGSSTVLPLILGDYARHLMELDRYKPTEEEIERYVEEIMIYQTEIFSRQYTLTEEEIRTIVRGCPVCINGVPTEEKEVSVHRDLERIPSNRIRGGMALVISEGVALKAMKIMDWAKKLGLDWSWLEKIIKVKKTSETKTEIKPNYKYLERMAAGRPLLAYPMKYGGFRLRYGRSRNTAIMGKGINPATMVVLDEFIAVGTHIRIERPGKAAQLFPCSSIDGPIVKLKNGNVVKLNSAEEAKKIKPQIEKILFLGDILVTLGDFRKSAHPLMPSSFVEEWYELELKKALKEKKLKEIKEEELNVKEMDPFTAVELSLQLNIPLHPKYLHYYTALNSEEIIELMKEARKAEKIFEKEKIVGVKFELKEKTKELMEKIGLPHSIKNEKIEIEKSYAYPLLKTLGALSTKEIPEKKGKVLELLSEASGIKIMDKGATFIGARMGRPEQAKAREMKGNPHGLFPIGNYGGNTRSINKALNALNATNKKLKVELGLFRCPECTRIIPFPRCDKCNTETTKISKCSKCGWIGKKEEKQCKQCNSLMLKAEEREISLEETINNALKKLNTRMPELVKGVKGLISDSKEAEPIEKAILRAKHKVHIFRDGTIRFELLNAPITHFKPKEINLSVKKVKELGYIKDINGKEIVSEEQVIEIFPQDIIVNEKAGEWLLKVTSFIDELLEKFYGLKAYYNKKSKEDLIGEIVIGLAPHTSAAIVGRIIGYSKARVGWSHPYFIACKRRNADGDQDSIMLLMDALLNFSEHYLPASRGGRMDAPLVFTTTLNPMEIDNEVHEMETVPFYPLEFYYKTLEFVEPNLKEVEIVKQKLGEKEQYTNLLFTHETECFDEGPKESMYVQLKTMEEKIRKQARLQHRIKAVEEKDALERVLVSHFLPDIIGNTRAFSKQNFRCTSCNTKYRRVPLIGKCTKCKGNLILTIAEGSVKKYVEIAREIIQEYNLGDYLKQRIELAEREISSVFKNDKIEQKLLYEYT